MNIAADLCLYTNKNFTIEVLDENTDKTEAINQEEGIAKANC